MAMTFDELVAAAKELPLDQQHRLAARLIGPVDGGEQNLRACLSWLDLAGTLPYPAFGEDAQAYITRTRREDTAHRDRLLGLSE